MQVYLDDCACMCHPAGQGQPEQGSANLTWPTACFFK